MTSNPFQPLSSLTGISRAVYHKICKERWPISLLILGQDTFLGHDIYPKSLSRPDLTFRVSNSVVLLIMEK